MRQIVRMALKLEDDVGTMAVFETANGKSRLYTIRRHRVANGRLDSAAQWLFIYDTERSGEVGYILNRSN